MDDLAAKIAECYEKGKLISCVKDILVNIRRRISGSQLTVISGSLITSTIHNEDEMDDIVTNLKLWKADRTQAYPVRKEGYETSVYTLNDIRRNVSYGDLIVETPSGSTAWVTNSDIQILKMAMALYCIGERDIKLDGVTGLPGIEEIQSYMEQIPCVVAMYYYSDVGDAYLQCAYPKAHTLINEKKEVLQKAGYSVYSISKDTLAVVATGSMDKLYDQLCEIGRKSLSTKTMILDILKKGDLQNIGDMERRLYEQEQPGVYVMNRIINESKYPSGNLFDLMGIYDTLSM